MDSSDVGHGSRERSKGAIVFFFRFCASATGQILGQTVYQTILWSTSDPKTQRFPEIDLTINLTPTQCQVDFWEAFRKHNGSLIIFLTLYFRNAWPGKSGVIFYLQVYNT